MLFRLNENAIFHNLTHILFQHNFPATKWNVPVPQLLYQADI